MAGILALLAILSPVALSASLHFPEVLLDPPSFAASLLSSNPFGVIASLALLLAQGVVLVMVSRPSPIGMAAGICIAASAVLALIPVLAQIAFVGVAIVAPSLIAIWTLRRGSGRVFRTLAALGLVIVAARSVVWLVNAHMPVDEGFYVTSAILSVLALPGQSLWAFRLLRPRLAWAGVVVVPVLAVLMIVSTPTPRTDDVPAVPSAAGHVRYAVGLALRQQFALPSTYDELLARRGQSTGIAVEKVDAGGVPAERICAPNASPDRVLLDLPGGGFILPPSANSRKHAAGISRETGACVLMLHYRLAPEHPFPAAVQDGVRAYRWLRAQGIPAARIAILGDSAGGNLTMATALSLRDSGDELPAALVSVSGIMDFTRSSETWRTKDNSETLITGGTVGYTIGSYAKGDPRDPLLSPIFADLRGLPPTLLMIGSQEVLLGDAIRMADRLREAQVQVRLEVWPGMPHAWSGARVETMETRLSTRHIATFISARIS